MFGIILCVVIAWQISVLAKRKGQNILLWIVVAVLCFFFAQVVGALLLFGMFYKGDYTSQEEMLTFMSNPVRALFITFSGVGGYLLIHYLLNRMPDKTINNSLTDDNKSTDEEE